MMSSFFLYLLLTLTAFDATQLSKTLEQYGMQTVHPPSNALDFSLLDTNGRSHSLSSHHGRWVLLTFWATWCAPCRSELPSLQKLHERFGSGQMTVLGIAIGSEANQVKSFINTYNLTFPVLIDEGNRIATMYKATGVPVSFLIDPTGRVLGIARGARDWTQAFPLFEALSAGSGSPAKNENHYTKEPDESLDLPVEITPPSALVEVTENEISVDKDFWLDIHVSWAGHLNDYILLPPTVQLPEDIVQQGIQASSNSISGTQKFTYRISLRATKEGSFALDPVEIRYTPHTEGQPLAERIQGPTIHVTAASLLGMKSIWWVYLGCIALLVGLCMIALLYLRKKRPTARSKTEVPKSVHWKLTLQEIHALRISGDVVGFLTLVKKLRHELGEQEPQETQKLQTLFDQVRYGNHTPEDQELDRLERQLDLWIKNRNDKKDVLADQGVQLRN